jgi:protein-S-isoprenylcysteine O-methyltransferase Ste14
MFLALRQILSILILPATVVVVVPLWIARRAGTGWTWPAEGAGWAALAAGAAVSAIGFLLFGASIRHFWVEGRGTLAPWDPPRRLVVTGPYRHVRNPMISGVIFMLFGLALGLRSAPHGRWAVAFAAINLVYIPLFEEPQLEARFGDAYRRYRTAVRRFLPGWAGSPAPRQPHFAALALRGSLRSVRARVREWIERE